MNHAPHGNAKFFFLPIYIYIYIYTCSGLFFWFWPLGFWLLGFLAFRLLGFLAFWLLVGLCGFWWLVWLWLFASSAFPIPLRQVFFTFMLCMIYVIYVSMYVCLHFFEHLGGGRLPTPPPPAAFRFFQRLNRHFFDPPNPLLLFRCLTMIEMHRYFSIITFSTIPRCGRGGLPPCNPPRSFATCIHTYIPLPCRTVSNCPKDVVMLGMLARHAGDVETMLGMLTG